MPKENKPVESSPPSAPKRRVLIVDDHAVLREGLATVINHQKDLVVCGQAEDVEDGLQALAKLVPDIALVDLSLTTGNGLDLVKQLKAKQPQIPALVLSLHDEAVYAKQALRAGARGYIMK